MPWDVSDQGVRIVLLISSDDGEGTEVEQCRSSAFVGNRRW